MSWVSFVLGPGGSHLCWAREGLIWWTCNRLVAPCLCEKAFGVIWAFLFCRDPTDPPTYSALDPLDYGFSEGKTIVEGVQRG